MRMINGLVHFGRNELKELAKRNPTLFELACEIADQAGINAQYTYSGKGVIVRSADDDGRLLCPLQVFYIPNAYRDNCSKLTCWSTTTNKYGCTPCWYGRRWNDFVASVYTTEEVE